MSGFILDDILNSIFDVSQGISYEYFDRPFRFSHIDNYLLRSILYVTFMQLPQHSDIIRPVRQQRRPRLLHCNCLLKLSDDATNFGQVHESLER